MKVYDILIVEENSPHKVVKSLCEGLEDFKEMLQLEDFYSDSMFKELKAKGYLISWRVREQE